jgi:hypothetical protein
MRRGPPERGNIGLLHFEECLGYPPDALFVVAVR